jgi:hypothetical protein
MRHRLGERVVLCEIARDKGGGVTQTTDEHRSADIECVDGCDGRHARITANNSSV